MYTIENDKVRFSVDNTGKLLELINKATGTNYAGGGALWRLIYQDGISLDEEFDSQGVIPEIRQDGKSITLTFSNSDSLVLAFNMGITISLVGDDLRFDLNLENKDDKR